jgi:Holliday junction resolvase
MKLRTYAKLRTLHDRFGPGVFGKIAQKLLALSFRATGATHVVERGVQGVDIDAVLAGAQYTVEVKTTVGPEFQLDEGNLRALRDRASDGYIPSVAVLRLTPGEDWMIAAPPLEELRPGPFLIDRYRAYRLPSLEAPVRSAFEEVVEEEFQTTMERGQRHLDEKLRSRGVRVSR